MACFWLCGYVKRGDKILSPQDNEQHVSQQQRCGTLLYNISTVALVDCNTSEVRGIGKLSNAQRLGVYVCFSHPKWKIYIFPTKFQQNCYSDWYSRPVHLDLNLSSNSQPHKSTYATRNIIATVPLPARPVTSTPRTGQTFSVSRSGPFKPISRSQNRGCRWKKKLGRIGGVTSY